MSLKDALKDACNQVLPQAAIFAAVWEVLVNNGMIDADDKLFYWAAGSDVDAALVEIRIAELELIPFCQMSTPTNSGLMIALSNLRQAFDSLGGDDDLRRDLDRQMKGSG